MCSWCSLRYQHMWTLIERCLWAFQGCINYFSIVVTKLYEHRNLSRKKTLFLATVPWGSIWFHGAHHIREGSITAIPQAWQEEQLKTCFPNHNQKADSAVEMTRVFEVPPSIPSGGLPPASPYLLVLTYLKWCHQLGPVIQIPEETGDTHLLQTITKVGGSERQAGPR